MNINTTTLLFENLTFVESQELLELANDCTVFGKCNFEHPLFVEWAKAGKFDSTQQLLTYSTVFAARCALSAALFLQQFYSS